MAQVTKQQTELIRKDIEQKGLSHPDLVEDLLDHICSAIESEMTEGENFEHAYAKVMRSFGKNELQQVQVKTQTLLAGKNIFYPNLLQATGLLLLYFLILFLAGFFIAPLIQSYPDSFRQHVVIIESIVVSGSLLLVIGFARIALTESSLTKVDLFPITSFPLSILPILTGIMFLCSIWIEMVNSWIPVSASTQAVLNDRMAHYAAVPVLLFLGIVWPVLSEILFRGIILNGLLRKYTPFKAILCSSLFFSVSLLNPYNAPTLFMIGLLGSWLFYRTHSLLPSILIQILALLPQLVYISWAQPQQYEQLFIWKNFIGHTSLYYTLSLVSFLLTILLIWRLKKKFDQQQPLFSIE